MRTFFAFLVNSWNGFTFLIALLIDKLNFWDFRELSQRFFDGSPQDQIRPLRPYQELK